MPKIIQLSPHVANLIAAGEVVERPASVIKELLENAVDAGASQVTVEIRGGGSTFMRVTDNGCGMTPEDAETAFLRHATSKLRTAEDLAAIGTMGFRGEALAAIASVSRIDLITKTAGAISGTSLTLEAGTVTDRGEAGCPEGTTIIIRDLFFNVPARMKFMKTDVAEGAKVTATVHQQALAHPEVAFRFIRDGKEVLSTPGSGDLEAAVYCVYGRDGGKLIKVSSSWEGYHLTGFVSKPTDARPSRSLQTFFVNDRPVKSRLLIAALEEAYRNQIMIGKFPACVLHLKLPANLVDVNVHPAKTEVKFLNEKAVFDCVHYGVLGALNKTPDRPQVQFAQKPAAPTPAPTTTQAPPPKQESFFRTMTPQEFKNFSGALQNAPQPAQARAIATAEAITKEARLGQNVTLPANPAKKQEEEGALPPIITVTKPATPPEPVIVHEPILPIYEPILPIPEPVTPEPIPAEPEQAQLPDTAPETTWRYVGELYNAYVIVEQGEDAFLIDKHAAHERILFDKLKANQERISAQALLTPVPCRLSPEGAAIALENRDFLMTLGFEVELFGDSTVLLRQIPMDLSPDAASETLESLVSDLLGGKREKAENIRDELLHTVACKAAIKAGWHTDEAELLALVRQVMAREDLKYCPHGRPICITLSKKQLEKQFKR